MSTKAEVELEYKGGEKAAAAASQERAVLAQAGYHQLGAVPWHVGQIPLGVREGGEGG